MRAAVEQNFEACHRSFVANDRDKERELAFMLLAQSLGEAFALGQAYKDFIQDATWACFRARHALKFSYVQRFRTPQSEWKHHLEPLVGALEVITAKLEAAAGIGLLEASA